MLGTEEYTYAWYSGRGACNDGTSLMSISLRINISKDSKDVNKS